MPSRILAIAASAAAFATRSHAQRYYDFVYEHGEGGTSDGDAMFLGLAPLFVAFAVYLLSLRLNPYRRREAEQFAAFNGYSIVIGFYLGGLIAVVLVFVARLFAPDLDRGAAIAFLVACQVLTLIVSRIVLSVRARRADP